MPVLAAVLAADLAAVALHPAAAHAIAGLPEIPRPVAKNPADRSVGEPIEEPVYDHAVHCAPKPKPGAGRMVRRLTKKAAGERWPKALPAGAGAKTSFWTANR